MLRAPIEPLRIDSVTVSFVPETALDAIAVMLILRRKLLREAGERQPPVLVDASPRSSWRTALIQ